MGHDVHDALVKAILQHPEHAASELKAILPAKLVRQLDFKTLELCPGSFVDRRLRHSHSDLLYRVRHRSKRRSVYLYLLVEHQSTPKPLLAFHLLSYLVSIWQRWLDDHPRARKLPGILSVVIYHGSPRFRPDADFLELIDLPEETLEIVREQLPSFRPLVDHLTATSEEEILSLTTRSSLVKLMCLCLKYARDPAGLATHVVRWAALYRDVLAGYGRVALTLIFEYILEVSPEVSDVVVERVQSMGDTELRDVMKTAADFLREEGRKQGRAQGRE